jgi:hypothetical protein
MQNRLPQILIVLLGGLAIAIGRLAADRWPPFPAKNVANWLPWFAVAAAALGAIDAAVPRRWLTWPLRVLLFGAIAWLTIRGLVPHILDTGSAVGWTVGVATLALLAAAALDRLDQREDAGPAATIACAAAIGFAGLVSIFSAMVLDMLPLLGAMGLILIAALLGLRWRSIRLGPGGHTFAIAILAALLTLVAFFADDRPHKAIPAIVLLSPLAAWAAMLPRLRERAWRGLIAAALAVSLVSAAAVAPHAIDYNAPDPETEEEGVGDYY